jgi:dTDP-L-rhamnose 4-epimerase
VTKVLVTGGAGFIGTAVTRALVDRGTDVVGLDSLVSQVHPDARASARAFPGSLVLGDVRDHEQVARASGGVSAIVHLAAETGVGQSMYEPERYHSVNVVGTEVVAAAAARLGVPLVVFSSRAVYGQGAFACPACGRSFTTRCCDAGSPSGSREDDPLFPVSVYGTTKAEAERAALTTMPEGTPLVILRPQNVVGPGQSLHNPYTGVLAAFLSRLKVGSPLSLYGDGTQTRDFVHVSDVASVVLWSLERAGRSSDHLILNVGSGRRTTLDELAAMAIAASPGAPVGVEHVDVKRAGDVEHACADLARLSVVGGPMPRTATADAVGEFIRWGWSLDGAPPQRWDQAIGELERKGLIS